MIHGQFTLLPHAFDTTEFSAVAAVLDYYGLPYSARSLNDYLHHHSYGSLMTEVADCLLQHGLITTMFNTNPELFSRNAWNELYLLDYPSINSDRFPPVTDIERVLSKGVLLQKIPATQAIIDRELAEKHLVVISYVPTLVQDIRPLGSSVAVIVAADEQQYTLFEPAFGDSMTMCPKQTCLLAILSVKSSDPSAASILIMKERTPAPIGPPPPLPEI